MATAFTDMIHLRERAEDELRRLHDNDRVAELAKTDVPGIFQRKSAEETLRLLNSQAEARTD